MATRAELSDRDKAMLTFEARHNRMSGRKEELILSTFGMSAARYFQIINALIDNPAALVFDPPLVKRLHRERARRAEARAARTFSASTAH